MKIKIKLEGVLLDFLNHKKNLYEEGFHNEILWVSTSIKDLNFYTIIHIIIQCENFQL